MKRVAIALALGFLVVSACTQAGTPNEGASAPTASKRGGTLHAFSSQPIGRIDPTTTQANYLQVIAVQVFGSLVRFGTGAQTVVPDLAEKWVVTDQALTYSFSMRSGLKFHDGTPIQLSDVVFSLQRAAAPTSVWKGSYTNVKSIAADTGANTVVIKLSTVDPFFLQKLATIGGSAIYPEAAVRKNGDQYATTADNTIGSGPYKLKQKTATELTFERFADFYEPANIDTISLRIIPDVNTQTLEFTAGNLDWNTSILSASDAARYRGDPAFAKTYKEFRTPDAFWYGFNPTVKPFDDIRVRQAIAMSLDMTEPVQVYGLGKVTHSLLHPDMPGYDANLTVYSKDLTKAKQLLQDAGIQGTLKFDLHVWNIPAFVAMTEAVQKQLNAAGFDVSLKVIEFGTFISEVSKGTYPFFINLGNIGVWDSADWLTNSFGSTGPFNVKYKNPAVDDQLKQALSEFDLPKRAQLAHQAEVLILKDAVAIPILNRIGGYVFQPWVRGVDSVTPIYPNVRLNELWLDPDRRK